MKSTVIIDELGSHANWGLNVIGVESIWRHTHGEGVKVAIIDTGIDINHKGLKDKVAAYTDTINQTKGCGDSNYHGTHVAGIIAGDNVGVAPKSKLYVASVLNEDGCGTAANILDGITFAINHKVDILCMSLGSRNTLPSIESRLKLAYQKGITIIAATGNHGAQFVNYPASSDYIIGVGGANKELTRAEFSNYGFDMDVIAPSVDILSTYKDNKYAYISGTSTASPFVAGGIALIKSYYRKQGIELAPKDIMNMLKNLRNKKDRHIGYGLFNIDRLLELKEMKHE